MKEILLAQLKKCADLNNDGELNIADLILAAQMILTYALTQKPEQEKK